jgi:cytochrome b
MDQNINSQIQKHPVKVWDFSIRLFHWSLVILIGFLWWSGTEGEEMDNHVLAGYSVLALISYRIIWGFLGSHHAKFVNFVRSPIKTIKAIPEVISVRSDSHYVGHNPVGGWMVVLLILALMAQGITGLGTTDDIFIDGPLVAYLDDDLISLFSSLHHQIADLLIALVILHLAAVLYHDAIKRERLIKAMVTGIKYSPHPVESSKLPTKRFISTIALLSFIGWWLLNNFSG